MSASAHPINSSIHGWNENEESVDATTGSEEEEGGERTMVEMTNAIVDPRTMMVHLAHTSAEKRQSDQRLHVVRGSIPLAFATVMRSRRFVAFTEMTILQVLRVFGVLLQRKTDYVEATQTK